MAFSAASGVNVNPSATFSDYNNNSSTVAGTSPSKGWSLERAKRAYTDYLDTKRAEIDEQQDARRFRHGSQWTAKEVSQLNLRKQPVVTINKISRKIHGIVGVLNKLKQDPKAFPRTPEHEQGAELATATINYVLQAGNFDMKDPICSEMAAIDGFAGLEMTLIKGDHGDPDVAFDVVNGPDFFYDPTSREADFSDCNYLGTARWYALDKAKDDFPDYADQFDAYSESGSEMSTNSDQEQKWFLADANRKRIRIVKLWYMKANEWRWKLFTGYFEIDDQPSFMFDEKGNSTHQYVMWSAYVDQDGDRYGFIRDLKPMQTEVNMRRSKALAIGLGRRIIAPQGSFDDIEVARREASRHDGVIIYNPQNEAPQFDDQARAMETETQFKFLEDIKADIETFGPNVALAQGTGLENASGRAINLLQQAGLADLGPFISSYRAWKIRLYRAVWNLVQRYWTAERWIRVTDDQQLAQFVQINGVGIDPQTGMPTLVNALGQLDVDIILDEGPDEVNAMGDAYDTLSVLATKASGIPPQLAKAWLEIQLELAPIPASIKQRCLAKLNPQPTPEDQQQQQLQQRGAEAEVSEKESAAKLKEAQAFRTLLEAGQPQGQGTPPENPGVVQSEIENKQADTRLKHAQADKTQVEAAMRPHEMAHEQAMDHVSAAQSQQDTQIRAHDSATRAQLGAQANELKGQQASEGSARPKKKKSSGVNLHLDGTIANQINESARANQESITALGKALVEAANRNADTLAQATSILAQAGHSMAQSSQAVAEAAGQMAQVASAPRRIVRDKSGRASHVEVG